MQYTHSYITEAITYPITAVKSNNYAHVLFCNNLGIAVETAARSTQHQHLHQVLLQQ